MGGEVEEEGEARGDGVVVGDHVGEGGGGEEAIEKDTCDAIRKLRQMRARGAERDSVIEMNNAVRLYFDFLIFDSRQSSNDSSVRTVTNWILASTRVF